MNTFQIHFIRHGATNANINGQYIGSTNVPLCEEGIKDIQNLKNALHYPNVGKIYCSPLDRCIQTSKIIYDQIEPCIVPELAECNFGSWEGKTAEELKDHPLFIDWLSSKNGVAPENGESLFDFNNRICSAFEKIVVDIVNNKIKDAAIITHGGVIMTLLATYGLPKAKFYDWIVGNACGYSARIIPSLWMRDKVMEVYAKVPLDIQNTQNLKNTEHILNFARAAADKAFGKSSNNK